LLYKKCYHEIKIKNIFITGKTTQLEYLKKSFYVSGCTEIQLNNLRPQLASLPIPQARFTSKTVPEEQLKPSPIKLRDRLTQIISIERIFFRFGLKLPNPSKGIKHWGWLSSLLIPFFPLQLSPCC